MNKLISPAYQALLKTYRQQRPTWGNQGARLASVITDLVMRYEVASVLDYGCGDGSLKTALLTHCPATFLTIDEYDPGVDGKETCPPGPYDLVVCRDVLEHVEPAYLDAVLTHLYTLTGTLCYCQIAHIPAPAVLPDGRNAHLSLFSPYEWARKFAAFPWTVILEEEDAVHGWFQCEK